MSDTISIVTQSSNSLVTNENLIKKVYFPGLVISIVGVFGGFIDFALAFISSDRDDAGLWIRVHDEYRLDAVALPAGGGLKFAWMNSGKINRFL